MMLTKEKDRHTRLLPDHISACDENSDKRKDAFVLTPHACLQLQAPAPSMPRQSATKQLYHQQDACTHLKEALVSKVQQCLPLHV